MTTAGGAQTAKPTPSATPAVSSISTLPIDSPLSFTLESPLRIRDGDAARIRLTRDVIVAKQLVARAGTASVVRLTPDGSRLTIDPLPTVGTVTLPVRPIDEAPRALRAGSTIEAITNAALQVSESGALALATPAPFRLNNADRPATEFTAIPVATYAPVVRPSPRGIRTPSPQPSAT